MALVDEEDGSGGAGGASLAGYEYQIDASVWLALDLVVVSRLTSALQLEPASQEDLEGELADSEPSRAVTQVPLGAYKLIVQVKRRGGDAWTPTTLKSLLLHGSDTRPSAAKRLADSASRYLLITSAGLNGDARQLKVRRAGNWPKHAALPDVIAEELPADAAGRVAVIANEDDERLRADIERLLTEGCRVPNANLDACRRKLREEARARIARAGGGWWRREELEHVVREHGGYLASAPELEHYVHPTNWSDLRAAMRERSAALIIGQSGTGKTLATKKLYDELRLEMPGLTRVSIRLGPQQLRDDQTPSPVLYDIEDPWGRFDFDPKSRPWNDQLARFFAEAGPNRMIVATSRLDVAQESKALDSVAAWLIKLEAEHYGAAERSRLYQSRISGLPRELQPLARGAERKVLDELATPLELQKFFDALRTLDRAGLKNPLGFIANAIRSAHQNAIENTVVDQIEERKDIRAAAVIWSLLKASDKLSQSVLREIEDGLADLDAAMERGVSPLVDFFIAARNLRQADGGIVAYYHPRVEAGVEKAMEAHRQEVRHTLKHLLDLLVSEDGPGGEWGTGAAARILAAGRSRFSVKASGPTVTKIDAWLEGRLTEGGKALESYIELAAEAGSAASNGAEVARFLLHRPDNTFPGFTVWGAPERSEAWYEARRADPRTKPLIEGFVREILPADRVSYPASLSEQLERLAPDLSGAFLDAAMQVVRFGVMQADDAIAEGALRDLVGFERIVDAAVAELTPNDADRNRAAQLRLDFANEVYSDDYAQHLAEDDEGHTAEVFLTAYIRQARATLGWRSLVTHRHAGRLLFYWLHQLAKEVKEKGADAEELQGVFRAAYGDEREDLLWLILQSAWDPVYLPPLRDRIVAGHTDEDVAQAALTCLIERAPDAFRSIMGELAADGGASRLVEIAIELAGLRWRRGGDGMRHSDAAEVAVQALPGPYRQISEAALAVDTNDTPTLDDEAQATLAAIASPSERVRRLRVALAAVAPSPAQEDVRWLLQHSADSATAVLAVEAAIRLDMDAEVEAALDHKFAHVSACALTTLGERADVPIPVRLLAKASDRGSPVRKALVALLKQKPHIAHLPALMILARDTWSRDEQHYGDDRDFPIARGAVEAIALAAPLPPAEARELMAIGLDTADPDVRTSIFRLLTNSGDPELQEQLLDLAVRPGQPGVRRAAAGGLLQGAEAVRPEILEKITAPLLATRYEPVAASLSLLLAWRGDQDRVRAVAEELATNADRRVLLLLLVWFMNKRNPPIAQEIAAMLPAGHPAVAWALGGVVVEPDDMLLADLGAPAICTRVLGFMRIKK
ncbi:nSTAND3 domain-containing NTPase [Azospirillum sp. sgz301742]